MYTKQQKSALTREINAQKDFIKNVSESFARQTPDADGMVWHFGQRKHAAGYLTILNRELRRMEAERKAMDAAVPDVNENNTLTDESAVICDESHNNLVNDKAEKIASFMIDNNILLTDVIDAVISNNGIIGVGLISLGEQLKEYVHGKISVNVESWNN